MEGGSHHLDIFRVDVLRDILVEDEVLLGGLQEFNYLALSVGVEKQPRKGLQHLAV